MSFPITRFSLFPSYIETKSQYDLLKEMHCDTIQGFYCAKPMPEKEYENLIKG